MLYSRESIKKEIDEMVQRLHDPLNYIEGVGKMPGEPSNIVFLRRDQQQRINQGRSFSRLRHERYVLTVNLHTEGLVCVEGQTMHLPVNYVSLVQPYQLHYYMVDQTDFCWLVITFDMIQQDFVKNLPDVSVAMTDFQFIRLYRMLQIYLEILGGNFGQVQLLQRMLGNFLREMCMGDAHANADNEQDGTPKNINEFERINKYIFSRIGDPTLSVNDIADDLNISVTKLYSIFRVMSECNPGDYIRTQRIRRAMRMLENPNLTVAEIARQNGFTSLAIFSRCFKKIVGLPPSKLVRKGF